MRTTVTYPFFHAFTVTTSSVFVCGTGGHADEMLVEAPLHEQQSALATVFIEEQTRVCMRNQETINSFPHKLYPWMVFLLQPVPDKLTT